MDGDRKTEDRVMCRAVTGDATCGLIDRLDWGDD